MTAERRWADELMDVGWSLMSELDQRVVFDRVLQTARDVTGARYAALGILNEDEDGLETFLTCGIDEHTRRVIGDLPRGRGLLGALIHDPRPLRLHDVGQHSSSYGFPAGHPVMRSFLGVPITIGGRVWGNLYLTEKAEGQFSEQDQRAAVILSGWAAIAIQNARLYEISEQRRERAERAARALEAARDITVAIGGETELERVLALIVQRARELVGASRVLIWLRDGDELVLHASTGHDGAEARGARIAIEDADAGGAFGLDAPLRVTGRSSARPPQIAGRLGIGDGESALLVPMIYRAGVVGVLVARADFLDTGGFTSDDEHVLSTFAASAATAVALTRSVAGDRLRGALAAAEAERTRWARELHDETLQSLGGLRMLLGASLRGSGDLAQTRETVVSAIDEVQGVIDGLRALITELRPAALDELGLRDALEALLDRHRKRGTFELMADLSLPQPTVRGRRLDSELESTAYRLVQEALTNITKHAEAGAVRVSAHQSDEQLTIEVQDDGRGFDPAGTGPGFGLTGMRERVALSDGSLTITSDHTGTLLRACLPLACRSTAGAVAAGVTAGRRSPTPDAPARGRPARFAAGALSQDWPAYARRFGDALRAADARQAEAVAQDALTAGLSLPGLDARVITPAMYRIGELWARRAITVADEHAATAIASGVLASLRPFTCTDSADPRETMLLATPAGERHGLGLRMVADTLDAAGFHVIYLGTDVPLDPLAQAIGAHAPDVTILSITLPRPPGEIRELIDVITRALPRGRLMIGGQGVPECLLDDRMCHVVSVESLIEHVDRVLAGPPALSDGASDAGAAACCPLALPLASGRRPRTSAG